MPAVDATARRGVWVSSVVRPWSARTMLPRTTETFAHERAVAQARREAEREASASARRQVMRSSGSAGSPGVAHVRDAGDERGGIERILGLLVDALDAHQPAVGRVGVGGVAPVRGPSASSRIR